MGGGDIGITVSIYLFLPVYPSECPDFVQMIFSELLNFLYQMWFGDCIVMSQSFMWKDWCAQGHSEGLYNQNMTISTLSSAVSFTTNLSFMVHHHKSECLLRKLERCVQGQGHSEGSKSQ